jgi:hypothetical protein
MCRDCKSKKQQALVEKWKKERFQGQNISQEKRCIYCQRTLPSSQFGGNIRSKDGLSNICKECQKKRKEEYKNRWREERGQNPEAISEKECPSCHRILDVSEFYQSNSHKDGLSFYCKECELNHQKKHRAEWKEDRALHRVKIPREKECNICHRVLPTSNFYKNRAFKDGLHSTCIQCETSRSRDYRNKWLEERSSNKILPEEKECATCHRTLSISMFYKNIRRKDGFTSSCIDCEKQRGIEYIEKWKEERGQKGANGSFTLFPAFEKECNICHRILTVAQFYKKSRSKDGLSSNCIECELKLTKERRLKRKKTRKKTVIPEEKFCKKCQRTLPSSKFHKNCDSSDGLARYCGECKNKMHKEYRSKPGVMEKLSEYKKEYRNRPGIREHERKRARKYARRPYVKEKRSAYYKEYYSRSEVKERRKKYLKEYYTRPKVKERVKQYYLEYQKRKKADKAV